MVWEQAVIVDTELAVTSGYFISGVVQYSCDFEWTSEFWFETSGQAGCMLRIDEFDEISNLVRWLSFDERVKITFLCGLSGNGSFFDCVVYSFCGFFHGRDVVGNVTEPGWRFKLAVEDDVGH